MTRFKAFKKALPLFWDTVAEVYLLQKKMSKVLLVPYKSALKSNQKGREWDDE